MCKYCTNNTRSPSNKETLFYRDHNLEWCMMTLVKVLYTLHEGKLRFKIFTEIKRAARIKKAAYVWAQKS